MNAGNARYTPRDPYNKNSLDLSHHNNDLTDVVDLLMPDGSSYTGQISKTTHLKHGKGNQIWPDGAQYVGDWENG